MSESMYTDIWSAEYGTWTHNVNIFVGMRGMGKTFSALAPWVRGEISEKVMINRLSNKETSIVTSEKGNMFKNICQKFPERPPLCFFHVRDDLYSINPYRVENYKAVVDGDDIGYCSSLLTLAGINGMGFEDVGFYIVDEFIPLRKYRYFGDKFADLMACWETINRNREAEGRPPCKLILLSNSNNIYDPVIRGFNLVSVAEQMCKNGEEHHFDEERSIAFHILKPKESFAEFKQNSAVAKATKGTDYGSMAYQNAFAYNDFSGVEPRTVNGCKPVASIARTAYIYHTQNGYHVTYRRAEVPDYPIHTRIYKRAFRRDFGYLEYSLANDEITYQSYELKELFLEAFN